MQPIDLSVCIVNWNTRERLRACLESILKSSDGLVLEVIVADNASRDGSQQMLRREFSQVKVIANEMNCGFGPACNQTIEVARGRIVLFLNSDTVVKPGALAAMVEHLDQHPLVGGVGCRLLNEDGSLQRSCWYGFTSLRSALIDAFYLWRLFPRSRFVRASEAVIENRGAAQAIAVDHLLGACLAVPSRVLTRVGLFDPRFFMFLEETDLCYRLKQAGYELHYLAGPSITHFGGQSTAQNPAMKRRLYQSQCIFLRKHGASAAYMAAFKVITALAAFVRILLWTWRLATQPPREAATACIISYAQAIFELPSY